MPAIKSLDDLKRIREETLDKRKVKTASGRAHIAVGMGTCGIASGARDTMKAILNYIDANDLSGIVVTQTGCMGMCEREPIVQVTVGEEAKVTYGKVNPEAAERIMKEHVLGGHIVIELEIE